ncbi:MAG: hypothetical protein WCV56_01870 [Candidatus Omnitrophota bacterium]
MRNIRKSIRDVGDAFSISARVGFFMVEDSSLVLRKDHCHRGMCM